MCVIMQQATCILSIITLFKVMTQSIIEMMMSDIWAVRSMMMMMMMMIMMMV